MKNMELKDEIIDNDELDKLIEKKIRNRNNKNEKNNKNKPSKQNKKEKKDKENKVKKIVFIVLKVILVLFILFAIFVFLFFKTSLFQKYKEIWVETAMSTMNHKYLATWFLSDEEIQAILDKLEVHNDEDSNSDEIIIAEVNEEEKTESKEIKVEKITGKNYVGYVMIVPDASKVKMVDSRKGSTGTKLTEIVSKNNAIAGINAGGFTDVDGKGLGGELCRPTIINKKLLFGASGVRYSLIGLSSDYKLVLGKYSYQEAINQGIVSAIEFGPYLIVNGKNQITNESSGGIHPRMAIGQRKDGTFIFVCIDGRQPGYSLGTNLLELQNIFNRYEAYNAANLDGGSSATMVYNGKVVNKTSTPAGQRYLPNAFIVEKD